MGLRAIRRNLPASMPQELRDAMDSIALNFEALRKLGFGEGVRIDGISFTAGNAVDIAHKLGRKPVGWRVVRARGSAARLYESLTTEPTSKVLRLNSQTTCVVDLEVW